MAGPASPHVPAASVSGARAIPGAVYFLSAVAGLGIANLYYAQPLLPAIAASVHASADSIAYVPALTQIGFATGIVVFLPLADVLDLRKLVAAMLVLVALATLCHGLATSLGGLLAAGFALGLVCIVPQLLTPYGALLAPAGLEGRCVGLVLSGILSGVLVSKIVAGFVADAVGWRWLYFGSSAAMLALAAVVLAVLPPHRAAQGGSYRALLATTIALARDHRALRRHALNGALAFAAFMTFWSNYAVHLARAYGLGPSAAGLLGFAGIAGILAASIAGREIDRGRFRRICVASGLLMTASFVVMAATPLGLPGLILGVVLLDTGMALCHSANQSSAFALAPHSRGRINAVYMTAYFVGGALGTAVGAWALARLGWLGLCAAGSIFAGLVAVLEGVAPIARPLAAERR